MAFSSRKTILFATAALCLAQLPAAAAQPGFGPMLVIAGVPGGSHTPGQGYLGIDIRDTPPELLPASRAKDLHGAEIVRVDHDGPAGKAGLREHDIVLSVNNTSVEGEQQLRRMLREMQPGRSVTLLISRDGSQQTISTTLTNRDELERRAWEQHWVVPEPESAPVIDPAVPSDSPSSPHGFAHGFVSGHLLPGGTYTAGAMVDAVGPQLADFFGMKDGKGILVHAVEPGSPAANAGIHAGDVITRVNGNPVASRTDWSRALRDSKGHNVNVTVMREHREQNIVMTPEPKRRSCVDPASPERRSLLAMVFSR